MLFMLFATAAANIEHTHKSLTQTLPTLRYSLLALQSFRYCCAHEHVHTCIWHACQRVRKATMSARTYISI
jgi:hypothetical protein